MTYDDISDNAGGGGAFLITYLSLVLTLKLTPILVQYNTDYVILMWLSQKTHLSSHVQHANFIQNLVS